ncbi:MAG: hypothetical protein QOF78_4200 [Phycisphaerales bacterium]|jgi:hypothetical protein|nr:hypothetical protein [Phycisphaerales bacterium]
MTRFALLGTSKITSFQAAGFAVALITGLGVMGSAQAATVLVDFGSNASFRGVSVPNPDVNGNYWNSIVPGAYVLNMIDTGNNATTIDLGFDTGVGTDSYNGPAGPTSFPPTAAEVAATDIDAAALGNMGIKEAAFDFAASPGSPNNNTRFQIQGLDPTKTYDLAFFGSHKFSDNDTTVYSVFTDSTYTTLVASTSLNVQQPGSPWLHNRDTLATLNNLAPQDSNILYVQFVGSLGGTGYLNDMRISEAVPEPSGLAICGVAALLAARRRRR